MLEQRQSYHHKDLRKALIETGIELVSTEGVLDNNFIYTQHASSSSTM